MFEAAAHLGRFRGHTGALPQGAAVHEQILDAEDFNRTHFEARTFVARTGRQDIDCPLLELGDGKIHDFAGYFERPPPNQGQSFRYIGVRSNGGFTARRTGKKLLIDGTVRHGYADRCNPSRTLARKSNTGTIAMRYNRRQDVAAESWYGPDGELTLRRVTWGNVY